MKKLYVAVLLILSMLFSNIVIPTKVVAAEDTLLGMNKVSENSYLELYFHPETTEIAVKVKKTGELWFSNPQDRELDAKADGVNKGKLSSQLSITYYNSSSQLDMKDNYNDSISKGQFKVSNIENGIKITYTIGTIEELIIAPNVISAERFEPFLNKLSNSDKKNVEKRYQKLSLSTLDESGKKEALEKYPTLEKNDLYVLRTGTSKFILKDIAELLKLAGYTKKDLDLDNKENNVRVQDPKEIFTIPLEYKLDNDNLVVSIPGSEIKYNKEFPLTQVKVLEFFGAADTKKQGYIFVPDGSGGLINLNNGKNHTRAYIGKVYGQDNTFKVTEKVQDILPVTMPVFGLKQDNKAFFAVIEDGDAFSTIYGDVSGRVNSYNTACAEFNTLPNEFLSLDEVMGNNKLQIFQPRIYGGSFQIRYSFLTGDDADYMGMAKWYQNYLVDKGKLTKKKVDDEIPFYLEVVGAIDKTKNFLGVPYKGMEKLTGYDEAEKLLSKLKENDVNNIKLRYTGWFNEGVSQTAASSLKLINKLGGKKGFYDLIEFTKDNGIEFFPDVDLQYAYDDTLFNGFSPSKEASRSLEKKVMLKSAFNLITNMPDEDKKSAYIISPNAIDSISNKFFKNFDDFNLLSISLNAIAADLNSDFRDNNLADRQQAIGKLTNKMKDIKEKGYNIMSNNINAYALPYVTDVVNMNMASNDFLIIDEGIPFYQIVTRGYIEYTGKPINMSANPKKEILKSMETGSGLYYKWIYGDNSVLKESDYNDMYAVNYKRSFDDAVETYKRCKDVLSDAQGMRIENHEKLKDGVYKVSYENGKSIVVNYTNQSFNYEGKLIAAEDFAEF